MSESAAGGVNPDDLYAELLASAKHPRKRRNLEELHRICKDRHDVKAGDWSISSIGRVLESSGYMTVNSLMQQQSSDYRALISAWKQKSLESRSPALLRQNPGGRKWFENIDDLAARAYAAALDAQVTELQGQVRLLQKWKGTVTINMDGTIADREKSPEAKRAHLLNIQEKRVLAECISAVSLANKTWSIGTRGELTDADGFVIFGAGWATGIKKLLELFDSYQSI